MSKRTIERIGKTTGRSPTYRLIVDGVELGQITRCLSAIGANYSHSRSDGWRISGLELESKEAAEQELIRRAIRFGDIKEA